VRGKEGVGQAEEDAVKHVLSAVHPGQDSDRWRALADTVMNLRVEKNGNKAVDLLTASAFIRCSGTAELWTL
jgi:hypothetical protein